MVVKRLTTESEVPARCVEADCEAAKQEFKVGKATKQNITVLLILYKYTFMHIN